MDKLREYNFKLCYRASRDQYIEVADGLSRMRTRLSSIPKSMNQNRLAMAALDRHTYPLRIAEYYKDRMAKYAQSRPCMSNS